MPNFRIINPGRARQADEHGSVVVVVVIIVTLSVALATLLATVQSNLRASRTDQDRTAAFQRANGGIDQALYRLDRRSWPVGTSLDADNQLNQVFTETVVSGAGSFAVTITPDSPLNSTSYTVTSVGTDEGSGRRRQAVATIAARPLFSEGFFMLEKFESRGTQTKDPEFADAYNSIVCPRAEDSCELTPTGAVGTNGIIRGSASTIETWVETFGRFNMYGRPRQSDADRDCGPDGVCTAKGGDVRGYSDSVLVEMPPASGSCPFVGGIVSGAIPPGDYTCSVVDLRGTITINPPGRVRIWATEQISAQGGVVANRFGSPSNLQIYFGAVRPNSSAICSGSNPEDKVEIWALLYTPGLNFSCQKPPAIFGAVFANIWDSEGNEFRFHHDVNATTAVNNGKYRILDWRECPVGQIC